eukprot:Lithocolla_globosa_v1_NODE_1638_length_2431_cov_23.401936.p2 type:complete len:107 gc:universal NODE_1638_length_2431_cov_23.401936:726-1046(+)
MEPQQLGSPRSRPPTVWLAKPLAFSSNSSGVVGRRIKRGFRSVTMAHATSRMMFEAVDLPHPKRFRRILKEHPFTTKYRKIANLVSGGIAFGAVFSRTWYNKPKTN